jgi:exopolyphosphatase/guanosine-5'-triphosphate,3'-diphosphate pyrophosphatase
VVDIGGGSTELIIGEGTEPLLMESLFMGGISYRSAFLSRAGRWTRSASMRPKCRRRGEIEAVVTDYQRCGWHEAVGSSGSAQELATVLELNGLNPSESKRHHVARGWPGCGR